MIVYQFTWTISISVHFPKYLTVYDIRQLVSSTCTMCNLCPARLDQVQLNLYVRRYLKKTYEWSSIILYSTDFIWLKKCVF